MKEGQITVNISHGMDEKICIELNKSDLLTLAEMVKDYSTGESGNATRIAKQLNDLAKRN